VDVVLLKISTFAPRLLTAECNVKAFTDRANEQMIIWNFISSDCISFSFLSIRQASRKIQQNKFNKTNLLGFYFRTVHVVIFILFKPTHALFLKHIHIHI